MVEIGYALMSEEHPPNDLVSNARQAEEAGFGYALISDHFHPWVPRQGNSPFVWSVVGAIAHATSTLRLGIGVTCPIIRIHPAIVAHAAATAAAMMPGRFFLGVGSGENLNEHVVGAGWPAADVRHEMLEEAIEIIRQLWSGEQVTYRGNWFDVEAAKLYTLPDQPPPLVVAASGEQAAKLAGRHGDGLVGLAPLSDLIDAFEEAGGEGKPKYAQVDVCWAEDEETARRTALEWWPQTGLRGQEETELRTPNQFEQSIALVTEDLVAERAQLGPDPDAHIEQIQQYADAGYDHVYVHQIGPDQAGFMKFYEQHVLPHFKQK